VSDPLLEARGLVKHFGHVQALGGVNLTADPGEVVALIGDNGAKGVQQAIAALDGKEVQKEIRTELIAVTEETTNDPDVGRHLYKANC
jgi:ABC-type branched-subunit amino acid transport system ATPase component